MRSMDSSGIVDWSILRESPAKIVSVSLEKIDIASSRVASIIVFPLKIFLTIRLHNRKTNPV